jgi:pimeloyl-ACP methyl ester carboxylesterase
MKHHNQKTKFLVLMCLSVAILSVLSSTISHSLASPQQQNKTLMQPRVQGMAANATTSTNIVLVHGFWADGSSWSKVIPILKNAGHKVIAVQLPLHSLADDIATVKRAIDLIGGPVILVGHSYGGIVITNAGYNNPNVTGLVYIAAFAPNEGQSLGDFFDVSKLPKDFLKTDSGGFAYINPNLFHDMFAQDVDLAQADIMATTQKPPSLSSILPEKSGPPAWKQLPTWYEVSGNDRMIPPDAERMFAKQINATTITVNASHVAFVSHPDQIAGLILNATKGSTK